jgi:hypothetical protein
MMEIPMFSGVFRLDVLCHFGPKTAKTTVAAPMTTNDKHDIV